MLSTSCYRAEPGPQVLFLSTSHVYELNEPIITEEITRITNLPPVVQCLGAEPGFDPADWLRAHALKHCAACLELNY